MKKNKEPGLIRQIIAIHYEQAKRRKALRQLAKMEWSMEFLTEVIRHAANMLNKDIEITLETKAGHRMTLSSVKNRHQTELSADNDIFNHLDDAAAVERFIRDHSRR